MLKITNVDALPNYRLRLQYDDGVKGEVDVSHLVGQGVFEIWKDIAMFQRVSIGSGHELRWSDEVDLCADALYLEITGKTPEELFPRLTEAKLHA